jgi:hypothetical protein
MNKNIAIEIAERWFAQSSKNLEITVKLEPSGDGWIGIATSVPKQNRPLPILRINPNGTVTVMGR